MINPVKGSTEMNLDKRKLSTPVQFHLTSTEAVQKSITGTHALPVWVPVLILSKTFDRTGVIEIDR